MSIEIQQPVFANGSPSKKIFIIPLVVFIGVPFLVIGIPRLFGDNSLMLLLYVAALIGTPIFWIFGFVHTIFAMFKKSSQLYKYYVYIALVIYLIVGILLFMLLRQGGSLFRIQ